MGAYSMGKGHLFPSVEGENLLPGRLENWQTAALDCVLGLLWVRKCFKLQSFQLLDPPPDQGLGPWTPDHAGGSVFRPPLSVTSVGQVCWLCPWTWGSAPDPLVGSCSLCPLAPAPDLPGIFIWRCLRDPIGGEAYEARRLVPPRNLEP